MASITEKRLSLHRNLEIKNQENCELRSQLAQLQHLANIGTVSHMIAHEINNLLTPLRSYATFALQNQDDKKLAEKALQKTAKNCERVSKIMESLLAMADGRQQEKENVKLLSLVEDVFTCLCRDFSKDNIKIEINIPSELTIHVVPVQMQQVFMNLIINARHAMIPGGGKLTITAARIDARPCDSTDEIEIEIADTGEGIKTEHLEHIFEAFFTTKNNKTSGERSGTGLGLAFCKKIIESHSGRISAESRQGFGCTFKIILPISQ